MVQCNPRNNFNIELFPNYGIVQLTYVHHVFIMVCMNTYLCTYMHTCVVTLFYVDYYSSVKGKEDFKPIARI